MRSKTPFPVERFAEIAETPDNYRLLKRIPFTYASRTWPAQLRPPVGDEIVVHIVDVETTGLDSDEDSIIELGLVEALISPSTGLLTRIETARSFYQDPGEPLRPEIVELTGITDEMVAGHTLPDSEILALLNKEDGILIAHNAKFDAAFIVARFPELAGRRWVCTVNDINWKARGFGSAKLDYICLNTGYFFDGHRAEVDCLAVAWLMCSSDVCLEMLQSEASPTHKVAATGSPFEVKDELKKNKFRWDPDNRYWHITVAPKDLDDTLNFLSDLYPGGGERATVIDQTSRERYAPNH